MHDDMFCKQRTRSNANSPQIFRDKNIMLVLSKHESIFDTKPNETRAALGAVEPLGPNDPEGQGQSTPFSKAACRLTRCIIGANLVTIG